MTAHEAEDLIAQISEFDFLLSTWEIDFLAAIQIIVESGKDLTQPQADKLQEIFVKVA